MENVCFHVVKIVNESDQYTGLFTFTPGGNAVVQRIDLKNSVLDRNQVAVFVSTVSIKVDMTFKLNIYMRNIFGCHDENVNTSKCISNWDRTR